MTRYSTFTAVAPVAHFVALSETPATMPSTHVITKAEVTATRVQYDEADASRIRAIQARVPSEADLESLGFDSNEWLNEPGWDR